MISILYTIIWTFCSTATREPPHTAVRSTLRRTHTQTAIVRTCGGIHIARAHHIIDDNIFRIYIHLNGIAIACRCVCASLSLIRNTCKCHYIRFLCVPYMCIWRSNLIAPSLSLMTFSNTNFTKKRRRKKFHRAKKIIFLMFVGFHTQNRVAFI